MDDKMKCIHCKHDNFINDEISAIFTGFNISAELGLSEASNFDYQLILCTDCIIGLFFGIISGMMGMEKRTITHKIISKALNHATSSYFIMLNQERENQRLSLRLG